MQELYTTRFSGTFRPLKFTLLIPYQILLTIQYTYSIVTSRILDLHIHGLETIGNFSFPPFIANFILDHKRSQK